MSEFRKLFVANTSKQHFEFCYRVPGNDRVFMNKIPVGGQVMLYKEAPIDVLEYIINQHQGHPKPFLISVDELSRHKGHIGLIYQFDKEIKASQIERKMHENDGALIERGKEIRMENAAALGVALDEQGADRGIDVGEVRTEIIEDIRTGEDTSGKIAEGVVVPRRARASK